MGVTSTGTGTGTGTAANLSCFMVVKIRHLIFLDWFRVE